MIFKGPAPGPRRGGIIKRFITILLIQQSISSTDRYPHVRRLYGAVVTV